MLEMTVLPGDCGREIRAFLYAFHGVGPRHRHSRLAFISKCGHSLEQQRRVKQQ